MNTHASLRSTQRFLIMLPLSATPSEQEHVVNVAKELTSTGDVYIASASQRTMEDRDNVRFLPLRSGDLPRFGKVSTVMIVKDRTMVPAAEQAYPDAKVLVFEPADSGQIVGYEQQRALSEALSLAA
jgi:hypothetical protein